jgi:hypothetical protein
MVARRVIMLIITPAPEMPASPNHNGGSTPTQAQQNYAQRRVNQVAMEEAQKVTTMVPGTSLVNSILS